MQINLKSFQDKFIFTEKKFPAFVGGWATGKSMSAIFKALLFSQESPNNLGLICRKEFTDLRDSTIKDFERYTGLKVNEGNKEVRLSNGSVIMFRHAEELDTLKNINLGWFWIEQAEELLSDEQWFYLIGRLRRESKRRAGWITANVDGHNWIYKLWKEHSHTEDYDLTEASTFDNKENLPEDFVKSLDSIPENIKRRFVTNDWNIAEGLVWPEYVDELHSCNSYEIPNDWKDTLALDHGHDHPTAIMFGAINYDGLLLIYNEHYEAGQLISYHAKRLKEIEPHWENMLRYIDPTCRFKNMQDGTRCYSVMEAYQDYGISFRPSPIEAMAAINKVAELFKANRIMIFKDKCPNLISEIKQWKWKKPRPGHEKLAKEEPVRLKEDACKALSYLVAGSLMAPDRPKKIIPEGKMTASRFEELVNEQREHNQYAYGSSN